MVAVAVFVGIGGGLLKVKRCMRYSKGCAFVVVVVW